MLILSRKRNQSITIGDSLVVTVRDIAERHAMIALNRAGGTISRRVDVGQDIELGGTMKLTLCSIHAGISRVGIDAPKHVPIVRDDAKSGPRQKSIDERLNA